MDSTQNRRLHMLLSQLDLMEMKATLISDVTGNRTSSSKEMTHAEANLLIKSLQQERDSRVSKTQKKIIHLMCLLGFVKDDGKPNYSRINNYVKEIGSRNPGKKNLADLTPKEMNAVCSQVEAWYKKEVKNEQH